MSDNGRPLFQRFRIWGLVAMILLVVIMVIISGPRPDGLRPISPEIPGDMSAHMSAPPAARATAPANKLGSHGVDSTVDICEFGKVPLDANDPFAAGRYIGEVTSNARNRWFPPC